jgi:hypothetical protein
MLAAACTPRPTPSCETGPDGVRLFIDRESGAYGDLVQALRNDPNQMIALAPPNAVRIGGSSRPAICKTDHTFAKVVTITYPSRNERHIGPILELYFGQDGRVEVAELGIMLLAP